MALAPGAKLGPYEVIAPLGAGGMGEVYRARDLKLNRDIAIKILPDLLARDHECLARFRREAQLLAALNHPHIAHVHGFEDSAGTYALIMELVEGPTLAEKMMEVSGTAPGGPGMPLDLTQLHDPTAMRAFDITPDGRHIVFDRLRENSDLVLIDLEK